MSRASATPRVGPSGDSNKIPSNMIGISTWNDPNSTPPWITGRNENAGKPIFRLPPELLARIMKLLPTEDLYFARQASITFQQIFSCEAFSNCHAAWSDLCPKYEKRAAQPPFAPFDHNTWIRLPFEFREPYVTTSLLNLGGRQLLGSGPLKKLSSPPLVAFKFPRTSAILEKKLEYTALLCPHYTLAEGRFSLLAEFYERSSQGAVSCPECKFAYKFQRVDRTVYLHGKVYMSTRLKSMRHMLEGGTYITDKGERDTASAAQVPLLSGLWIDAIKKGMCE